MPPYQYVEGMEIMWLANWPPYPPSRLWCQVVFLRVFFCRLFWVSCEEIITTETQRGGAATEKGQFPFSGEKIWVSCANLSGIVVTKHTKNWKSKFS